jgi:hypothetical protein
MGGPGTQDYILRQMQGLMGDNGLQYSQLSGNAYGPMATADITGRKDETPLWQKSLGAILPSAASAAMGAFTGGMTAKPSGGGSSGGYDYFSQGA